MKMMMMYFPSSNTKNIEGVTNEAPEEDISEKATSRYVQKNHPESQILGEKGSGVQQEKLL